MADHTIWRFLTDSLQRGDPAALLTVVDSTGSSPGKPGAKLVVGQNGALVGTIGGGALEHALIEQARRLLNEARRPVSLIHRRHNPNTAGPQSDMICGGSQTVAIHRCDQTDLPTCSAILSTLRKRQSGLLQLGAEGLLFTLTNDIGRMPPRLFHDENGNWRYEEILGQYPTAFLIGGGHVSLALSRVLALLDFRIVVLDERPCLTTLLDNRDAHEKRTLDYGAISAHVPGGSQHYVIIMTAGHRDDERVLRQLLGKPLGYLGMLGSRIKVAEIMGRLGKEFPETQLRRVRAPIGLPIGSHTPAEIAVSIAAEMIKVRNDTRSDAASH